MERRGDESEACRQGRQAAAAAAVDRGGEDAAMLIAPEQGSCEGGERHFVSPKVMLQSRSNYHWDEMLKLLRRCTHAAAI